MKKIVLLTAILLFFSLLIWFLLIRKPDFADVRGTQRFNVLLITLDTTRADRLGCYGYKKIRTPNIDSLATNGILYEKCISPTPLTLPAHTSIFTGTYPLFHGVRDNAAFVVPENLTTLAEIFHQNGFRTAAFVSSFVLDSKWGLNQGFDFYFDHFDLHQENIVSVGDIQRKGNETTDQALAWLAKNGSHQFFVWLHLYDAHSPYDPPEEYKNLYPDDPYVGEIAFDDYQIGRLMQWLDQNGIRKNTFVIVAGDHGESLGEHQEQGHGFFIYEETLHVPFIISTPFKGFRSIRKNQIVSLVDLAPTVLDMCGIKKDQMFQGRSLVNTFLKDSKSTEQFVYSETFYPRFHFGWSELQSIQDGKMKFIRSSESELFDLQKDPDEMQNLAPGEKFKTSAYESKIKTWIDKWSQGAKSQDYSQVDEETQGKLAALGYIGTFSKIQPNLKLPTPRKKIAIYTQLSEARELTLSSNFEKAETLIRNIIRQDPSIMDAYSTLGNLYLKQNRTEEAVQEYRKALELKPDDAALIAGIAACELKLGKPEEAEKTLLDSLKIVPSDSKVYFMLGNVYRAKKEDQKAIEAYRHCIKLNPKSASAYNALAAIYFLQKDFSAARENVEAALKLDERLPGIHYTQAQMLEQEGRLQEAAIEYTKELSFSPKNFRAAYNLSTIYRQLGNSTEEERYLQKSIELNQEFPLSYLYLARVRMKSGKDYSGAIQLVQESLQRNLEPKYRALAYFLLADLYSRMGNQRLSQEYAAKGKSIP